MHISKASLLSTLAASFSSIPPGSVVARYAQVSPGVFAVVSSRGRVLGSSFFAIRSAFVFHSFVFGAGQWVVLLPRQASLF